MHLLKLKKLHRSTPKAYAISVVHFPSPQLLSLYRLSLLYGSSHIGVLSHELKDVLLVHEIILILLPLEGCAVEELVSQAGGTNILLDLHIVVREPGNFASLPGEDAQVPLVVEWDEEEQSVKDDVELVGVAPHGGVRRFHRHFSNFF